MLLCRSKTCSVAVREEAERVGTGDSVKAAQCERNIAHTTPATTDPVNGAMGWTSEEERGSTAQAKTKQRQGGGRFRGLANRNQELASLSLGGNS